MVNQRLSDRLSNNGKKIFVDEIDNYDFCVNTMKIEKSFRKDFDNRIKQLCEDFCDQADERKFFRLLRTCQTAPRASPRGHSSRNFHLFGLVRVSTWLQMTLHHW